MEVEQRYAQMKRECRAILFWCEKFQYFILGKESVEIKTDHKLLEAIVEKSRLTAPKRLQHMLLHLQRYALKVLYKQGTEMHIADFLWHALLSMIISDDGVDSDVTSDMDRKPSIWQNSSMFQENVTTTYFRAQSKIQYWKNWVKVVMQGWPEKRENTLALVREYRPYHGELNV